MSLMALLAQSNRRALSRLVTLILATVLLTLLGLGLSSSGHAPSIIHSSPALDYVKTLKSSTQAYWRQKICPGDALSDTTIDDFAQRGDAPFLHVAVEEKAGHHNEVWPSFVYTLSQLPNVKTSVYLRGGSARPASNRMDAVIADFYESSHTKEWDQLVADLSVEEPRDQRIDAIVSTTCGETLRKSNQQLLDVHDARKVKFRIVCTMHHAEIHNLDSLVSLLAPWVQRNSMILQGLSPHVTRSLRENLSIMAVLAEHKQSFSPDVIPIHTFVPVFPVSSGLLTLERKGQRPSRAAIQGTITTGRRNYGIVFQSLVEEIEANPKLWGCKLPDDRSAPFEIDDQVEDPFKLVLLGALAEKDLIPARLQSVVEILSGLDYVKYYEALHESDVVIPAFRGTAYYTVAASSSIAAAVIAQVPVLGTRLHLEAYSYLDGRGLVLHPEDVNPIRAIARLRSNGTTLASSTSQIGGFADSAFKASRAQDAPAAMSRKIHASNLLSINRMLRQGLPDYAFAGRE